MNKPRVAIPVPTSFDFEYNAQSWPEYAVAVEQSGAQAVKVPLNLSSNEITDLVKSCQGILLPGSGADVNPEKYGQAKIEACAAADPAREDVDELLLYHAHSLQKPILGICFGLQTLNVWRGGSLVQDVTIMPVNHVAGKAVSVAHMALVSPGSLLGSLLTEDEAPVDGDFRRLPVNSSHHQAVGVPGDGLRVVARCPQDGVIEAVEGAQNAVGVEHFVVGVQWHPERSYGSSRTSRALFGRFVAEVGMWKPDLVQASTLSEDFLI